MPKTRYAKSGDVHIAYQVVGDGPIDVVYVPTWFSHVEILWEEPSVARFFECFASFARLVLFDRRGSGLSDPIAGPATLEEQMDDVLAVMQAAGSERAAIFAQMEGCAMAALFAATHPERTQALVLYSGFARVTAAPGYDWAPSAEERAAHGGWAEAVEHWGEGTLADRFAPNLAHDDQFRDWFGRLERYSASPGSARNINRSVGETDVRAVLPTIGVPALVLHRPDAQLFDVRHSRYLADHIPGARYLELPGSDSLPVLGDTEALVGEVEEFLTGARTSTGRDRVLSTVLFTDIVDSTARAAVMGDPAWRAALDRHHNVVRRNLTRFRGREVKTLGDGFLATFDGPARAIRCAVEIERDLHDADMPIRAGLHTGECEVMGNDVGGLAVHIAARVAARADADEVLVSSTVRDLVVGSGIRFEERGEAELKGVPDRWRLFAVESVD